MGKTLNLSNSFQTYLFHGTLPEWSSLMAFFVSLHTGDPTNGNQSSNELSYSGYARIAVPRTGSGWEIDSNVIKNGEMLNFGPPDVDDIIITHLGIGTDVSGPGHLLHVATPATQYRAISGRPIIVPVGSLRITES